MQAAGDRIGFAAEFRAGMEHGHDGFQRGFTGRRMDFDGDTAAVVFHGNGIIFFDGDFDMRAVAGHGFVDAVVNNFIDQMVQAALVGAADVHTGTAAHRFPSA